MAIPMLPEMSSWRLSTDSGFSSSSRIRSAIPLAVWSSGMFGRRVPNSSPPNRARRSSSRRTVESRGPISFRSRSPKWCPSVSLISLKWSRSISITATSSWPSRFDLLPQVGLEQGAVGQVRQRVVQGLIRVLLLTGFELDRRVLEGLRSGEHLPCEHERRDEDRDRPWADTDERGGHDDREQGEAHVREDELTEHSDVHLPEDAQRRLAGPHVQIKRHEHRVDPVPDERAEKDRRPQSVPG